MTKIIHRNDTATNWTTTNPVLDAGEIGIETDTLKFKIGDGLTTWNNLAYQGTNVDLSNYYTKLETYNKTETDTLLAGNYTKTQADNLFATKTDLADKQDGFVAQSPLSVVAQADNSTISFNGSYTTSYDYATGVYSYPFDAENTWLEIIIEIPDDVDIDVHDDYWKIGDSSLQHIFNLPSGFNNSNISLFEIDANDGTDNVTVARLWYGSKAYRQGNSTTSISNPIRDCLAEHVANSTDIKSGNGSGNIANGYSENIVSGYRLSRVRLACSCQITGSWYNDFYSSDWGSYWTDSIGAKLKSLKLYTSLSDTEGTELIVYEIYDKLNLSIGSGLAIQNGALVNTNPSATDLTNFYTKAEANALYSDIPVGLDLSITSGVLSAQAGHVKSTNGVLVSNSAINTSSINSVETGVTNGVILGNTVGYETVQISDDIGTYIYCDNYSQSDSLNTLTALNSMEENVKGAWIFASSPQGNNSSSWSHYGFLFDIPLPAGQYKFNMTSSHYGHLTLCSGELGDFTIEHRADYTNTINDYIVNVSNPISAIVWVVGNYKGYQAPYNLTVEEYVSTQVFDTYLCKSNSTLSLKLAKNISDLSSFDDYAKIGQVKYDSSLINPTVVPTDNLADTFLTGKLVTEDNILNKLPIGSGLTISNGALVNTNPTVLTVDQTYDGTSTNAQSGVAVASALSSALSGKVTGTGINNIVAISQADYDAIGAYYAYTYDNTTVYIRTTEPSTETTVYSAVDTTSALTISSVGTDEIELSDGNTYERDTSSDTSDSSAYATTTLYVIR